MNNSSFNHSNKERRLIHFAEVPDNAPQENPESRLAKLREQVSAGARARFDALNLKWKRDGETIQDRMAALTALSQLSDTEESELLVQSANLAELLGPDGVQKVAELYGAFKAGKEDDFKRIFDSMTPEDRSAIAQNDSAVLRKFARLITERSKVDQIGDKVENFLERNEDQIQRFIAMIAEIIQKFQGLMEQIQDALEYNPRIIATKDRFIDKQIKDTKVAPEIIESHKANTIAELKKMDSAGDETSIEKKKARLGDYETERQQALATPNATTKKLPTATEQDAINKRIDDAIAKTKKEIADMEAAQQAGETRKPELLARLAAINERMNIPDPLNGYKTTSTESVAETEPAEEVSPTKTPEEIEAEAKVAAMEKAKAALSSIDTMLKGRKEKDGEVDVKIAELNTALLKMDESEREVFVKAENVLSTSVDEGDSGHRIMQTSDGAVYEVKYKDDFALDFRKYEKGVEE